MAEPIPGAPTLQTVLFDLDGTLADTAPDLASALNRLLREEGREPLPLARVRSHVSRGGVGLVRLAWGDRQDTASDERRRARLLEIYAADLSTRTRLFSGAAAALEYIEAHGMRWGVVTNKPGWLTEPLIEALGLAGRAACVVSGDSTAHRKPHPEPLLHACRCLGSAPAHCVYIGDDPRDIQAGKAAGMPTLVAGYGYIDATEEPRAWAADGLLDSLAELPAWLEQRRATLS